MQGAGPDRRITTLAVREDIAEREREKERGECYSVLTKLLTNVFFIISVKSREVRTQVEQNIR